MESSAAPATSAEQVPFRFARSVLRAVAAQGYDPAALLNSMGLDSAWLGDAAPSHINAAVYNRLYTHVMWLFEDESFGLQLGEKIPAGSFRMMSLCVIHCANLEHAIRRASEFGNFCRRLTGQPVSPASVLTVTDGIATAHLTDNPQLFGLPCVENVTGVAWSLSCWRRFLGWLISRNIEPVEVVFRAPEPANTAPLYELFACPLRFRGETDGLRFADHYLRTSILQTEASLREFLRDAPFHLIVGDNSDDDNIVACMRRIVGNDFSRDFPTVAKMAQTLNMSVRTLRRHLKREGLTFQKFKDNIRMSAAIQYLNRPELNINTVAALMGFGEPSAFHRSFKKWTGHTPGEYRTSRNVH